MNQPAASDESNSSADAPANAQELVKQTDLYPELLAYLNQRAAEFEQIPDERKADLARLADYIRQRQAGDGGARITFICTHNSRRSHLAQVWAQVAAYYYAVPRCPPIPAARRSPRSTRERQRPFNVPVCGSRPTNPPQPIRAIEWRPVIAGRRSSVTRSGLTKLPIPRAASPPCLTAPKPTRPARWSAVAICDCRSAMMTPKAADGTAEEAAVYDQRSRQIGREMLYVMWLLKQA